MAIAKNMAQRQVKLMLLTGNPDSPIKPYATLTLATKQTEFDILKVGTFASQIAFEYMLDTLFAIVYARQYQEYLGKLKTNFDTMISGDIQAPQRPK